jgi:hypothetical protein
MNNDAAAKIKMLEDSMRCFAYGLLGLLPVIGLPFALVALWNAGRVRIREKHYWNAASAYCLWGGICGALGAIFWVMVETLLVYNLATGAWNND